MILANNPLEKPLFSGDIQFSGASQKSDSAAPVRKTNNPAAAGHGLELMNSIVFTNGNIITLDDAGPRADSLAVRGDRIVFVGAKEGAAATGNPETDVIDLAGRTLVPGFNDNHLHAVSMGDYFSRPNLLGLDVSEIMETLLAAEKDLEAGEMLQAFGWDYPHCLNPHRRLLDTHFPNRPVALFQYSGHAVWGNTRLLEKLKVTPRTPDPPGGEIERDREGVPTGILKDKAVFPLHFRRFLRMNLKPNLRTPLFEKALRLFRENGITSVQDNTWMPFAVPHFNRLRKRGALSARISCWSYGDLGWARYWLEHQRFDSKWVRKGPRKFFIDGTFSTRTAMLLQAYAGEPENFGLPSIPADRLRRVLDKGIRQGRQLAFHAIGDRAVHEFLNTLEDLKPEIERVRRLRLRLEHAQLIAPQDLDRMARWGILPAVQPSALVDAEKDRALLNGARAARAYPFRSILAAGLPLSFGSDVPGESMFKPLELIHLAVNRESPERISPLEALRAYTSGSAYAEFMETEKGTLTPGKLADIAVLSEDPTRVPPERIKDIRVEMTLVGGKKVWDNTDASISS